MKFEDYKEIRTDEQGYRFVKTGVMITSEEKPCLICKTPTKYIEVCSETHFCSDECVKTFYKQVSKFEKLGLDFEGEINKISSKYHISNGHVGCFLSNYENDYICHKHNGGCKNIDICRKIKEEIDNGEVKVMTPEQKIDYMIQSLQLAKEEITYAGKYLNEKNKDKEFYQYGHMGQGRTPNGTIIRESLKQVGRIANIVANDVVLSPYSNHVFRESME